MELDKYLDLNGLMPPLPADLVSKIKLDPPLTATGKHTFLPYLLTKDDFKNKIAPILKQEIDPSLFTFIEDRVQKTFEIRHQLNLLKDKIISIVGVGNFSTLYIDREAFSSDSMEHRALMTEAVIHVYSCEALEKIVQLLYTNNIPMIPYGEGGGYNMGVTPMAPAVTISLRGINHVSDIRPSRRTPNKFEISVGAGVPFKDLIAYLTKRGFVLRCDPNTPRAATGGIAATGSNGGRKAFEVIIHGRAVTLNGQAVQFALSDEEEKKIQEEPFLMARKFFSIEKLNDLKQRLEKIKKKKSPATIQPNSHKMVIPLQRMKSRANMLAQKAEDQQTDRADVLCDTQALPLSAFVGSEGTTGFIYEVTFEIEKPLDWLESSCWHFKDIEAAILVTRAIKKLPKQEQPEYFEFISGQSIQRYLMQDFPNFFSSSDAGVIILAVEGKTRSHCFNRHILTEKVFNDALIQAGYNPDQVINKFNKSSCMNQKLGIEEFELMRKPREELPKKLRTKCKTDMEIRTEYLGEVLKIINQTQLSSSSIEKQDVLFGHLSPNHTAIIHWNIGGFDLYDEEQADIAWDYLEEVFAKSQSLAPKEDKYGSARSSGEHGVAGKAPFLWLNYIPKEDFNRMCAVKDLLDPKGLFNPETLFLRTSHSRALRARLLNTSSRLLKELPFVPLDLHEKEKLILKNIRQAEDFAITEGQRCTRCTSCKICPVIDAEHELEQDKKRNTKHSVLPSKRNLIMFLEKIVHIRRQSETSSSEAFTTKIKQITNSAIKEGSSLLSKCFYCRRCDKSCPVNIEIHPLMRAYHTMGQLPRMGSYFWGFLYTRIMGEDKFKFITLKLLSIVLILFRPVLAILRSNKYLPNWLKTYTVPPTFSVKHYEVKQCGIKIKETDNFVIVSSNPKNISVVGHSEYAKNTVYIRYRGCMDTFGKPEATSSVDSYFKNILNARIIDLEKKMCCGFPFEGDGLHDKAVQMQFLSLLEIIKCVYRLQQESHENELSFVIFSNCPTCCEAIREMLQLLKNDDLIQRIYTRSRIPQTFDIKSISFSVSDTAEIALYLLKEQEKNKKLSVEIIKADKRVGLKTPCHNTNTATKAQIELLNKYYHCTINYDRCCGLSGAGRLKHPKIGTKIAEKLFEMIREDVPEVIVSGCPSCRDGVILQKDTQENQKEYAMHFEVKAIFEQIITDHMNNTLKPR